MRYVLFKLRDDINRRNTGTRSTLYWIPTLENASCSCLGGSENPYFSLYMTCNRVLHQHGAAGNRRMICLAGDHAPSCRSEVGRAWDARVGAAEMIARVRDRSGKAAEGIALGKRTT
jgi:hypothetical protein